MSGIEHRLANLADFRLTVGLYALQDNEPLDVVRFRGVEELGELFSYRIELCSRNDRVSAEQILRQAAALEITGDYGTRFVHGIISRFERIGRTSGITYYAVELVPEHWLLARRFQSRIFQAHNCPDMSVPGIIQRVLEEANYPGSSFDFWLDRGAYAPREYVVQYRETDLNFIKRLMEEEGLCFFYAHSPQGSKLIVSDSSSLLALENGEFPIVEANGLVPEREFAFNVQERHNIEFGTVALDDFDFTKPVAADLRVTASGPAEISGLMHDDYPGRYFERDIGQRYAQNRLLACDWQRHVYELETTIRILSPACEFTLRNPETDASIGPLQAIRIEEEGYQPQSGREYTLPAGKRPYVARVTAIPTCTPYRPPIRTHRPVVRGSQTAIVVGPQTEEIYTDLYGRVKVQFHWDREQRFDEYSSCWIRVSQGWAGGKFGMLFLPRIGEEVIVDFLEGDPDRPIITGRVYNHEHETPYPLPSEKTKSCIKTSSSKGDRACHEIRFEDKAGEEQLLIQAARRMDTRVNGVHYHTVGGTYHLHIGGEKDGQLYGDKRELIYKDKHLHVKGQVQERIEKDVTTQVAGHTAVNIQKSFSSLIEGDVSELHLRNHRVSVSETHLLSAGRVKIEADLGIELVCGGSSIVLTPSGIFIQGGPMVNINGGAGPSVPAPSLKLNDAIEFKVLDPGVAERTPPGKSVRYGPNGHTLPPLTPPHCERRRGQPVYPPSPSNPVYGQFRLVDGAESAVPNEPYRLRFPDGTEQAGATDGDGRVHYTLTHPGAPSIQFPNRYDGEWHYLRTDPLGNGSIDPAPVRAP